MLPVMTEPSACPTFSRMKLGQSAVLLVSPGWALMASSSTSLLRCRATAGSSGRQCLLLARCWNIHNSRAGASTSWSFSSRCRQVHLRAMGCDEHRDEEGCGRVESDTVVLSGRHCARVEEKLAQTSPEVASLLVPSMHGAKKCRRACREKPGPRAGPARLTRPFA